MAPALWARACAVPDALTDRGRLERVVDGDTLWLRDGRKLRVIGVNAPELGYQQRVDQPLAQAARRFAQEFWAADDRVLLRYDVQRRDRYQRELVHVYRGDGQNYAAALLGAGLAFAVVVPPNDHDWRCYHQQEKRARAQALGVWGLPFYRAKPAEELSADDAGFQRVRLRVERVQSAGAVWWLEGGNVALRLHRDDLPSFAGLSPDSLRGRSLEVRGWLIDRSRSPGVAAKAYKPFMMHLRHSGMLELD